MEYKRLKEEFKYSQQKLQSTKQALRDVTNKKTVLEKSKEISFKKLETFKAKYASLEDEYSKLQVNSVDQSLLISEFETDANNSDRDVLSVCSKIDGRAYPRDIRKLYYSLLADQIPASKVAEVIKSVLKTSHPSIDIEQIQLQQKSCASYMRKEELKTVSNAHKSTVMC